MTGTPAIDIRYGRVDEASELAEMSRELIEEGLRWSWKPPRIVSMMQHPDSVVLVARTRLEIAGFAIMEFHDRHAHLNLLAVANARRREGTGAALLNWLEKSARVAGIEQVRLEVRRDNEGARAFYRTREYDEVAMLPGYYQGREHGVRMVLHLIEPSVARQRPH